MSNGHEAEGTLREAKRLRRDVEVRSSRWYSRYLALAGTAMLAVYSIYALPIPWKWVAFAVLMAGGLVFFWRYERSQQVHRRTSQRRVLAAMGSYFALVIVLVVVGDWLFAQQPTWWWLASAVVVSLPFFVASYLERRSAPGWRRVGDRELA